MLTRRGRNPLLGPKPSDVRKVTRQSLQSELRSLHRWLGTYKASQKLKLDGYANDVEAYARDILGIRLTPDQASAAQAAYKYKRVLMPSGNEVGKSMMCAILALHHFDCYNPSFTIVTAPAAKQLGDIIFKEMRTLAPNKIGWKPAANHLEDAPNHWVKGYTAKDENAFHGRHEQNVMVIFDEAEGVPKKFWDAAESMGDIIVAAYNPILTSSPAAIAERNSRWVIRRMSALTHPNVLADLEGRERFIPGNSAVNAEKVLSRLQAWATPIQEDDLPHPDDIMFGKQRWRLGPVAQARLAGIRPTGATNSVFSESLWLKMVENKCEIESHWPLQVGVDVARFGDDFTAIVIRRGKCVLHAEKRNGWTGRQTISRIMTLLNNYVTAREDVRRIPILVDDTGGYGESVIECNDERYRVIPVNFGWKAAKDTGAESYVDTRTELWFNFANLVDNGLVDATRLSQEMLSELHDELIMPNYDYDKRQRYIMCPKTTTKSVLGRSPDLADALVLAFAVSPSFYESYTVLN
jgi:hypothetical protein